MAVGMLGLGVDLARRPGAELGEARPPAIQGVRRDAAEDRVQIAVVVEKVARVGNGSRIGHAESVPSPYTNGH